jgi:hypothetical protein
MRLPASAPFVFALFMLSAASASFARIGENQDEFDRRILQPDIGKLTPKRKSADPANTEQLLRQQPFFTTREHFPPGIRERLYWKSAVPRMLSNENGWRVHVFFHETRSVLEAYLRVGDTLNEFEIQNILRANQGDSVWREVDPESEEAAAAPARSQFRARGWHAKGPHRWELVDDLFLKTRGLREGATSRHSRKGCDPTDRAPA